MKEDTSLSNSTVSLNSIDNYSRETDRTIYLGDLDLDTNEEHLYEFFASMQLKVVKIVKQPHSSFAHVTFDDPHVASQLLTNAVIRMKNKVIRIMPFNQPTNFDPNAKLIIKNLESYVNESDIIQKFRRFGDILSCKLVRDQNGESKCYAFLQFKLNESALNAIDKFNNTYWDERCDPDYKLKKYHEKLFMLKHAQKMGKLNAADLKNSELFMDLGNRMGKKIYVGIFKKKGEYIKIKSNKEGKPTNLYVKNLGTNFGDRDLFNLFKAFGSIKSAKVRRARIGLIEKPLGCGFVDFENPDEAENARLSLNGFVLPENGRTISVDYADCKSRRMRRKNESSATDETSTNQDDMASTFETVSQQPNTQTFYYDQDQSDRKSSISSESSLSLNDFSVVDPVELEWPDTWSKLLQTSTWKEYRLFPSS